jgi:hypothetical protein
VNALLSAGFVVNLMPGQYYVNTPVNIPPYGVLCGPLGVTLNSFSGSNFPSSLPRITAVPGFSGAGLIQIQSQTPGGWSVPSAGQTVRGVFLDGSGLTGTQSGIAINGPVYDTHLEDVFIYKGYDGISVASHVEAVGKPSYPYHQRYDRVSVVNCSNYGFNLTNFTDSTFVNCLAFANKNSNWLLSNIANSLLLDCRAEWSYTGDGFEVTGSGGSISLTGCTSDQNSGSGLHVNAHNE